jgi:hypothetical protein
MYWSPTKQNSPKLLAETRSNAAKPPDRHWKFQLRSPVLFVSEL